MEEWKEYKISEVIDEISMGPFGSNIKVDNFINLGVPVLNGSNLQGFKLNEDSFNYVSQEKADSLGKANAHKGDVVITHRGTLGQIVYIPEESKYEQYVISQSQFRLQLKQELIRPDFFVYFFHTRLGQHRILMNASQVGVPALARPTSTFKEVLVPVPPMKVQVKILSILKSLDDKIELNRKINANLEAQAQALFKSWFVDFEPFKDQPFVESELGMIPEGWRVGSLDEILTLKKNSYKKGDDNSLPYLPIDIIPIHSLGIYEFKDNNEAQSSLQTFEQNDIVVGAMRVYFHRVVIAPCKGITRSTCFVLRANNEDMWAYGVLQCNQDDAINYANRTSKGSTMPYATWTNGFGNYKVLIPSIDVLRRFNSVVSPMLDSIRDSYKESRRLASLRDALLPRLMSGELKVNEVI